MKTWHGYLGLMIALGGVFLASMCRAEEEGSLCSSLPTMVRYLHDKYGELPIRVGLAENVGVMLFENLDTGTATIVQIDPSGKACAIGAAALWKVLSPKQKESSL